MKVECIKPSPWEGLEFGDVYTVISTFETEFQDKIITMYVLAELDRPVWENGWWSIRFKPINRTTNKQEEVCCLSSMD